MSFLIKRIHMTLSKESLERAIMEINFIRDNLHPALMYLIGKLAEKGVEIARAELIFFSDPAFDTGALSESVKYEYTDDEKAAKITAGEGCYIGEDPSKGGWDPSTSYAMFVEYGTGMYGADVNEHGDAGWYYYNNRSGQWVHTIGMAARPFMSNAYNGIIDEVEANGGRIVAEYLADRAVGLG